jgi:hypothetical protein
VRGGLPLVTVGANTIHIDAVAVNGVASRAGEAGGAAAASELLDVTDDAKIAARLIVDIGGEVILETGAGLIGGDRLAGMGDARFAGEMALLTDGIPLRGREAERLHNVLFRRPAEVRVVRPVTSFAGDSRGGLGAGAIGVAEKALGGNAAIEIGMREAFIARGKAKAAFAGIHGDRGLKEFSGDADKESDGMLSGSDLKGGLVPGLDAVSS